ncbi:pullulanase [Streptococcus sp. S784/96/1]|uniref:pullulanase n=1 Tax=Streptococcus sp. S784/96/1 TaxID=2653499 RepID=UPI001386EA6F|nr:pullulanase [Streptococcus sp. S784/96/1]
MFFNPKKQGRSYSEKRVVFSIRRLKVGVASVTIASALFLGTTVGNRTVSADVLVEDTETVIVPKKEIPVTIDTKTSNQTGNETLQPITSETVDEQVSPVEASATSIEEPVAVTTPEELEAVPAKTSETVSATPLNTASETDQEKATPIEKQRIRLHFEGLEEDNISSYGLWMWGAVAEPSDGNKWPTDVKPFVESQKDDFGYYIDVKQSESLGKIGYLLLKNGEKVGEDDRELIPLTPEMNEVWIRSDFTTYSYKPLMDENILRLHYKREDGKYDGWGVWAWGDTSASFEKWPSDALDFTGRDDKGVYLDIPLSKGKASNIGFLLVNQKDDQAPGNKTKDLAFADRENHSHVFITAGDDAVYTNPYGVATQTTQDFSKATPGQGGITVSASSYRPFHYNETGLIDLSVINPNQVKVTRMEVDTKAIGGGVIEISSELNRVTITASSTTAAGNYELPVRVYDENNGHYDTKVTVTVKERNKVKGERDWDEQVIYFMVTDRFNNGDSSNDDAKVLSSVKNKAGAYQGGDFKGVTNKLDYLKQLGVSSIWITPIVENVSDNFGTEKDGEYYAYHGYWAKNFEKLNPHLGTLKDFHTLIDEAAARGINIIVDVVLNHSGYGTTDQFSGLVRKPEEEISGDDQKGSLSNLPDFKTEEMTVRQQLVNWQTAWLKTATTPKGNSIYGFRVDTVKHVDDVTWQHFKNELALKDPDFHLVGESWGANYKDTKGDLGTGTMDSLLDFGFKEIAKLAVGGRLKAANEELVARNDVLSSNYTLAQFLGSHDEDGFLYSIGGDEGKLKLAASLLLTAKGQPVIYYGEELGQSGANNWPVYDNRYLFDWDKVATSSVLSHYQKLLAFRNAHSELMARGNRSTVAANDSQQWLLAKREIDKDSAYMLYQLKDQVQTLQLEVSEQAIVTDAYSQKSYQATQDSSGKWFVTVEVPSLSDGGTMLLTTSAGNIVGVTSPTTDEAPIAENTLRMHFKKLASEDVKSLGLWTWGDVETPSEKVAGWPTGATSFADAKEDDYGYYLDVKLIDTNRSKISYLINNVGGTNLTGDKSIDIISQEMNEVWLDEEFKAHYYRPQAKGTIRINYFRTDGNYDKKALWLWGSAESSITNKLGTWPNGVDFENKGKYGVYIDVPLANFDELGFLLLDESKDGDAAKINPNNYSFKDLQNHTQIFLRNEDPTIYTNPYFTNLVRVTGAIQLSQSKIEANFSTLAEIDSASLLQELKVTDQAGKTIAVTDVELDTAGKKVILTGDFKETLAPFKVSYHSDSVMTRQSWQYKDSLYAYDGELGSRVKNGGKTVEMTLWSPSADSISVVIYDKGDQTKMLGEVAMVASEKGIWQLSLTDQNDLGISDYRGYYYHYKINRDGKEVLVLDPYAKSLAAWNSDLVSDDNPASKVAKAAFVDPSSIGPKVSEAKIKGYTSREDAIIYEAHVRDFTSDQALEGKLSHPFGTFSAFIEKLDYLKDLGVTHIQLLPVMSYYFINELSTRERMTGYDSSDTNYNWGYDPQSYFALTGAYSTEPQNPEKRIAEFKELVNAIHERGMGVILDVVYNHTAKVDLFEDLEPNYYHFMDGEGKAKSSFGGGRLGTTHHMSRRVLIDSIKYLVSEYKVDGFRFDMMGDHDAESIELAFKAAQAINPNILMLGEGWVTYTGDANDERQPADQTWMKLTDTVASFSDDIRNQLKSGYPNEGTPAFLTGGARDIRTIFKNIKAQPTNFTADDPGDVIQYIAAHDNLTLFDIIAQSIKKDPSIPENNAEIHRRLRLGNLLILTSQGTPFIHSGQEYGRTKQFKDEAYKTPVSAELVPNKSHLLTDKDGKPFVYPYFIHDSYDSTDAINHFDWAKATDAQLFPENTKSQAYTKGVIALRKSTDAFRLKDLASVNKQVTLLTIPGENGVAENDLVIGYQVKASNGDTYAVLINADDKERVITLADDFKALRGAEVLADAEQAGVIAIENPIGIAWTEKGIRLNALTATILRLKAKNDEKTSLELTDAATGVRVLMDKKESVPVAGLKITHLEPTSDQIPQILEGIDFDLYDIEVVDAAGRVLELTAPAQVFLPTDSGKKVKAVVYLPNGQTAEKLKFTETVYDNQIGVVFTAEHFSHYGIIYQMMSNTSVTQKENPLKQDLEKELSYNSSQLVLNQVSNNVFHKVANQTSHSDSQTLPDTGDDDSVYLALAGLVQLLALGGVLTQKYHQG